MKLQQTLVGFLGRSTWCICAPALSLAVSWRLRAACVTGLLPMLLLLTASSDLASASWTSLQSCTITNGSVYFSDPLWTNYPARLYRIRSP